MPLFTWLGGWLLRLTSPLTGPALLPLRFLSLTATLITASLLYAIGRREGAGRIVAFAGAALFLAGYQIAGGFYDLARVDMLFIALSLAGMALAVYASNSAWGLIGAGLLMGLAFLTKQNGLFLAAVVGGYLLLTVRRRLWLYVLSLILVAGLPTLWLHFSSDGWFSFYVFDIAYASPLSWQRLAATLGREIMGAMTVLALAFRIAGPPFAQTTPLAGAPAAALAIVHPGGTVCHSCRPLFCGRQLEQLDSRLRSVMPDAGAHGG